MLGKTLRNDTTIKIEIMNVFFLIVDEIDNVWYNLLYLIITLCISIRNMIFLIVCLLLGYIKYYLIIILWHLIMKIYLILKLWYI